MMNLKLQSSIAASVAVLGIVACSNGGADGSRFGAPTGPAADVAVSVPETATLCKDGPAGTYTFTVSNSGSTNTGDVLVPSPSITVLTPGTPVCTSVFTRSQYAGGATDPAAILAITENAAPGTTLSSITTQNSQAFAPVVDLPNRTVTVGVNAFHNATANFLNVAASRGCTFTQGWYKNHTLSWPAGALTPNTQFDGGQTIIDLFNTPPKGSAYIILAHQYLTALLNIQGGASVPSNVQAALDAAAAYFNAGGAGTGSGNITGLSDILDAYNNGLTGPGHCS